MKIKDQNEKTKVLNVPTKWSDITLEKYADIIQITENGGDNMELRLVACVAGLDYNDLLNLRSSYYPRLLQAIEFINDYDSLMAFRKVSIKYKSVGRESVGLLELSRAKINRMSEQNKNIWYAAGYIYALYHQKHTDGKTDEDKAAEIEKEFLQSPITEMIGPCSFFLTKFQHSYKNSLRSLRRNMNRTRSTRVSKS